MFIRPVRDAALISAPFLLLTVAGVFLAKLQYFSAAAMAGGLGAIFTLALFAIVVMLRKRGCDFTLRQEAILSMMEKKEAEISEANRVLSLEQDKVSKLREIVSSLTSSAGRSVYKSIEGLESVSQSSDNMLSSMRELKTKAALYRSELSDASDKVIGAMKMADSMMAVNEKVNEALVQIPKITAQINLVALNATIESSRAGEVGKGFAVVAAEVKKLARETFEVTQNVTDYLSEGSSAASESNQLVASMVDVMHDTKRMIEDTIIIISEHDDNLEKIRESLGGLVNNLNDVDYELSSLKSKASAIA